MRAIVKQGSDLLFLRGASGKNLEDIKDQLIVNFNDRYSILGWHFWKKKNQLEIHTIYGRVMIGFSGPVADIEEESFCKDQLVYKVKKEI